MPRLHEYRLPNEHFLCAFAALREKFFFVYFVFFISTHLAAQTLPIGHQTINFIDPARNNRVIATEVYYPATQSGENVPVASGSFPVLVFGHGFQMGYDSYLYLKTALVPLGYFFLLPKTESSLAPSHAEFGADLAFLIVRMKQEGQNPLSPFYQHVDSTSSVMGHSMGGGAAFLASQNNQVPTAMITMAAAETTPSAISAATDIIIPSLVFSADKDCVTPPAQHQIPMYDSLQSACKFFVNIKGGGHCYFADANFICSLGEIGCPAFTINREQQHSATVDFLIPYLDYYLKNNAMSWTLFNDSLVSSPRITYMKSCTTTSVSPILNNHPLRIFPAPVSGPFWISGIPTGATECLYTIFNQTGQVQFSGMVFPNEAGTIEFSNVASFPPGIYLVRIITPQLVYYLRFLKI